MLAVFFLGVAGSGWAGFAGTDVYLPSVGVGPGAQQSNWFTTAWISNPTDQIAMLQIFFLDRGNSNPAPDVFSAEIAPGETHRFGNVVEELFGAGNRFGAIRVVSDRKLLVNSRIFSVAPGGGEPESVGQFFGAMPATFAIGAGQSTELLGVFQFTPTDQSPFRYNFGFVETAGGNVTVRVRAFSDDGLEVTTRDYSLGPHGVAQYNVSEVVPGIQHTNIRLQLEVLTGNGEILAFGSSIANVSNDPSTFEMAFSDELLGSGSGSTTVVHDSTLTGDGTIGAPLGLADDAVTEPKIAASNTPSDGDGLTFTPAGLQWRAVSGGGGLTLPYSGTVSVQDVAFSITNTDASINGDGIEGRTESGVGVAGVASAYSGSGVAGYHVQTQVGGTLGNAMAGVEGNACGGVAGSVGVKGKGCGGRGVLGESEDSAGVRGESINGEGVSGFSTGANRSGVRGENDESNGYGVFGRNTSNQNRGYVGGPDAGLWGQGQGVSHGIIGEASGSGNAGQFNGNVQITGNLTVDGTLSKGGGTFRIDHPLDPANRTLSHSFVESPEMLNVYDGVVVLGRNGVAWVELPGYFEALNRDFRYQLTCVGGYAPVYIAEEIAGNRFKIAGGVAGLKVSWQVNGVRQDAWAEANRFIVEADKAPEQRGLYIHPEAFGLPPDGL
jgi:hypothetical protein